MIKIFDSAGMGTVVMLDRSGKFQFTTLHMRNLILVCLLVIVISYKSNSQVLFTDTLPVGRVTYSHQVQLSEMQSKNGTSELLFNSKRSVYVHRGDPNEKGTYYPDPSGVLIKAVGGDKQGAPIYKMHSERRMLYRDVCVGGQGRYIVSDTLGINWTLQPAHKRIGQFDCRRATGIFHGREYEAWYTLDIPLPSGPFKLGGLPGLILEARTLDGSAEFSFVSIEISNTIQEKIKPPYGKDSGLNYAQYQQAMWDFMTNKIQEFRATGMDVSVHTNPNALELWEPEK
jgi:GLPGLI family protein